MCIEQLVIPSDREAEKMKEKKQRSHLITEKAPLIAIAFWVIFAFVLEIVLDGLFKSFVPSDGTKMIGNISSISMSILLMIFMKVWYSPQYQGTLKSGLPFKLTMLVMVPMVIKSAVVLIIQLFQYNFWFDPSLFNIVKALAAGFWEECVFRVTIIPIAMGFIKTEKKIWLLPAISGLIFGIMHMVNISGGASITNSLVQALVTALDGFFYGALFVVTGSAFPGIILHSVYDFICFAGDKSLTDGIMTISLQTWEIIFNIVLSLIVFAGGVMIIRKVGKNKILSVWRKKWSQKEAAIQG